MGEAMPMPSLGDVAKLIDAISNTPGAQIIESVGKDASKTVFNALGNWMNEGTDYRRARSANEFQQALQSNMQKLTKDLQSAQTDNDIKKAWIAFDQRKMEESERQRRESELLNQQYQREDTAIAKKEALTDEDRKNTREYKNWLQNQIYLAPDPATRVALTQQLSGLYSAGGSGYVDLPHKIQMNIANKAREFKKSGKGKYIKKGKGAPETIDKATLYNPYIGKPGSTEFASNSFFARRPDKGTSFSFTDSYRITPEFRDFFEEDEYDNLPDGFKI